MQKNQFSDDLGRVIVELGSYVQTPRLCIKIAYKYKDELKRELGAMWYGQYRRWHVAWSPVTYAQLVRFCLDRDLHIEGDEHVEELAEQTTEVHRSRWVAGLDGAHLPSFPIGGPHEPWPHQKKVFHFAKNLRAAGLYVDMGGGKSAVAIGLMEHWQAQQVLILCPKSVLGVWPKQFNGVRNEVTGEEEFAGFGLRPYDIWVGNQSGTVARKANNLAAHLLRNSVTPNPSVTVLNYDAAWRPAMADLLLAQTWDVVVYDEGHKIKAPGGKASKFCARLSRKARRVLELTGTPQPHGPEDLYAQFRALDPAIYGTSWTRFKNRYFETRPINDKVDRIVGFRDERAREEFVAKARSISIVVPRSEFAVGSKRLPPVERQVALEPLTYRVYRQLRDELVTEVDAGIVTADNILVKGLRLRQITSGHVKTEDGVVSTVGDEKRQLLADVFDDIPCDGEGHREPVVVFGVFHHDLDVIRDVAVAAGCVYGELSGRRRDGLTEHSTMAPEIDVLGCQIQSGGVGIDLTRSAYGVYYSTDYNLGNVEQSFSRLDRPGQTRPVTFIHLVATTPTGGQTIDGLVLKALDGRRNFNQQLLDALRRKEV